MNLYTSNRISRYFILMVFTIMTLLVPVTLFYIGCKPSSIDLKNVISKFGFTLENYQMLLFGDSSVAKAYRDSILNSIVYSIFVGFFVTLFTVISNIWISGYPRKRAISITFVLLTLILLPQTYLVISGLKILNQVFILSNEIIRIMLFLFISVLPVSIWFFYIISGDKIRKLSLLIALDSLNQFETVKIILKDAWIHILLLFIFTFTLVWGNFLIPFSFGSIDTFTVTVQVSSFTTNLGRDWALISAGSFLLIAPILLLITIGLTIYERK